MNTGLATDPRGSAPHGCKAPARSVWVDERVTGHVPSGHLDGPRPWRQRLSGMRPELGIAVHLRDAETMDDLADVTAPGP